MSIIGARLVTQSPCTLTDLWGRTFPPSAAFGASSNPKAPAVNHPAGIALSVTHRKGHMTKYNTLLGGPGVSKHEKGEG